MFITTQDGTRINMRFVKYFEPFETDDAKAVDCRFRFIDGNEKTGIISKSELTRIDGRPIAQSPIAKI